MLAFGITTVRNPAAQTKGGVELRNRLASGEIIGPRMFTAGMLIDAPEAVMGGEIVETEEEIREVVRQQAKAGVNYIKLYTSLTPDLVKAAIDKGHSLEVKVIGHLGKTSWTYASNAGIPALEVIKIATNNGAKALNIRNCTNPLQLGISIHCNNYIFII